MKSMRRSSLSAFLINSNRSFLCDSVPLWPIFAFFSSPLERVMSRFTVALLGGHHENEKPEPDRRKLYERVIESDQTAGHSRRRGDVCRNGERPGTTLPVRGHDLPRDSLSTLSRQRVLRGHGGQSRKRAGDEDAPHLLPRYSV